MAEDEELIDARTRDAWVVGICGFTGLWGILTGFAVFILIRTGDFSNPLNFIAGLGVAAVASSIVEALREAIRGEIAVHPTRRISSIVVTVVTLLVFELFILAAHNAVDIFGHAKDIVELREALLGPAFSDTGSATIDLIVLALIWVITGSVIGLALGAFVVRETGTSGVRERTIRGGVTGVVAATIAAPVLVLLYVLVWRVCAAIALGVSAPDQLAAHYQSVLLGMNGVKLVGAAAIFVYVGTFAIFGLLKLWLWSLGGKLAVAALIAVVIAIGKRFDEWRPLYVVGAGCFAGIAAPLLVDFGDVFRLALLAAVVWFVPGLVLGLAAPLLEEPSDRANIWAFVATALGIAVAILTALRWHELASRNVLFLALAVTFFAAALLFARFRDLREFWPALALCLSSIAASLTFLLVSLTASFHGVLAEVATIDLLPASIAPSPSALRLQRDAHGFALNWRTKTRAIPSDDHPIIDETTFASVATMPAADRVALFAEKRAAILALRPQAVQQLAAVARLGRPPVTLSAQMLASAAAVRAFGEGERNRAREKMSNDFALFKSATSEAARISADDDERWWSRHLVDVDVAAGRVLSGDALIDDMRVVEAGDAPAQERIDADRAFSAGAAPEQLEVALAGSFAFWLTVGLLSAWAIRRRETLPASTDTSEATETVLEPVD